MAVRALPEFAARNAFDAGARYAARRGGPAQLRKNLARVIGVAPGEVPDSLMRASLASYGRYWREAFRLPTMDLPALARQLDDSIQGAERLKPESLYRRFIAYREGLGFEVLPLSGAERPPFEVLCDRLRANRVVCLMAERDLTRTGVEVDFFGEPTRMPAGPAKLAIETGAPLLPTACWFEDDGWGVHIQPALDCTSGDVRAITQALADRFAENIAGRPEDWHMMQAQWLADLSAERRVRLARLEEP
jgi:KDO2-lipid IV(A) lauroyltransferase